MKSHDAFYLSTVESFVQKNHAALAHLFGVRARDVTHDDLKLLMEHSVGEQARAYFERRGRLDSPILQEIALIPASERSVKFLAPAIAKTEISMAMNKPIHKARLIDPQYGSALKPFIEEYRRSRMRREMQALASTAVDIEANTIRLMAAVERFKAEPSFENKTRVKVAIKKVNKSLLVAHRRARIGAVWALRSGFSSDAVTKAIHRLYTKRMKNLATGMSRLDQYIAKQGIKSHLADGIQKRQRILTHELFKASANPTLLKKTRYDREEQDILQGLSYG